MSNKEIKRYYINQLFESGYKFDDFISPLQVFEYYLLGDEKSKELRFFHLAFSKKAAMHFFGNNWSDKLKDMIVTDNYYQFLENHLKNYESRDF